MLPFTMYGGRTAYAAYIKKPLAMSLMIFKFKMSRLSSKDVFL
jgi:hypothetical protein